MKSYKFVLKKMFNIEIIVNLIDVHKFIFPPLNENTPRK